MDEKKLKVGEWAGRWQSRVQSRHENRSHSLDIWAQIQRVHHLGEPLMKLIGGRTPRELRRSKGGLIFQDP